MPHSYTHADAEAWVSLLAQMSEPSYWAIEVDGCAVGGIGVILGDGLQLKLGNLGYWLGEPYWGRGIMTAAVRAASQYATSRFRLLRLEAQVFEWNPASMGVLEKCGFVPETVLRRSVLKDGELIDSVLYVRVLQLAAEQRAGADRSRAVLCLL